MIKPQPLAPNRVSGRALKVGDTIEVWWPPKRDTITALRPYSGAAKYSEGARIATFAIHTGGMTIDNGGLYTLATNPEA